MAVPVVLIVVITLADILAPQSIHLAPLLVVAPALTASFGGSRLTALIGALAVAALVAIAVIRTSVFTSNHESQLLALIVICAFTVLFCRLRERRSAELRQVRSVAEAAQQVVLHPLPDRMGSLRIASAYRAATDQARIGGDLYAAVRTATGTRLLLGDVRGKGLPAIEESALVLGALRCAAHREPELCALRRELDAIVGWSRCQPSEDCSDTEESFITAVLVDIPDDTPVIRVLNCGHPPPIRVHDARAIVLAPRQYTTPLGMDVPQTPEAVVDTFAFEPGDTLVLYTDGVTEARDRAGRFYPLVDRISVLPDTGTPEELIGRLRDDLLAFCDGTLADDAAAVVIRREPVTGDPAQRPVKTRWPARRSSVVDRSCGGPAGDGGTGPARPVDRRGTAPGSGAPSSPGHAADSP
ncbi:PP2C family protein-serine/threonine phosphatase [Streptomyces sp. NPDC004393]|uniref:PP2C family protein-serine/threonine phosphatase n=1 Tax=Streptomyces sp. NPDC004533 TaxID=3154278 RepID=UPI0033B8F860